MSQETKCAVCGRVLTPYDTKVKDDGKSYCPVCYGKMTPGNENTATAGGKQEERWKSPGNPAGSGFFNQRGATALRDADNLVECTNCGWIITRDRLEKDARGKLRCPRCGRKSVAPPEGAPKKDKSEKTKPEKPGTEDFAVTAQLFKCLGDPCRVKIIEWLARKSCASSSSSTSPGSSTRPYPTTSRCSRRWAWFSRASEATSWSTR